ncbi:unnamed protein product [Cuscuta campestris]|uniref:Secreted protein n=1 Tax=Cuscuta campestris TaxID=132261 RepID=A0A484M7B2_9ASTE|nr:unnamed protein product [Cuscuta campestris]
MFQHHINVPTISPLTLAFFLGHVFLQELCDLTPGLMWDTSTIRHAVLVRPRLPLAIGNGGSLDYGYDISKLGVNLTILALLRDMLMQW